MVLGCRTESWPSAAPATCSCFTCPFLLYLPRNTAGKVSSWWKEVEAQHRHCQLCAQQFRLPAGMKQGLKHFQVTPSAISFSCSTPAPLNHSVSGIPTLLGGTGCCVPPALLPKPPKHPCCDSNLLALAAVQAHQQLSPGAELAIGIVEPRFLKAAKPAANTQLLSGQLKFRVGCEELQKDFTKSSE